jgi:metallo-beta-lactamase family protein
MKITFLGAAHEVTGSCTLIEVGDKKGIVDCGMEQGKDLFENQELPVAASVLDFVLVTHAHIDHSGLLPLLYKNGFRGAVYATGATCSLLDIMLRDCAHIQMAEAEWKSRKALRRGEGPVAPLYDLEDVDGLMKLLHPCEYGRQLQVNEAVTVRFTDVGHLLGSAAIEIWLKEGSCEKKIVFSGDIGNIDQPILCDPKHIEKTDYLVIESTYGDRNHSDTRPDYVGSLAQYIQRTFDRGGNVIIPSFAVGRTQELLYFIREVKNRGLVKGHGDFRVYVDSPLAIEATSVFLQCDTSYIDEEMKEIIRSGENPLYFSGLNLAVSQEESRAINEDKTPKVIISASGMCDAGRVRHHLKHNLWRPECLVLFVGYQAVGTLGRALHDGAKEVKLFNEEIEVKAEIAALPGVSGHADKRGLIAWLEGFSEKPELVFVNHGDPESADSFTACLNDELGYRAFAPYSGTEFDVAAGRFTVIAQPKPIVKTHDAPHSPRKVNPLFTELVQAAEALMQAVCGCEGRPNRDLRTFISAVRKLTEKIGR